MHLYVWTLVINHNRGGRKRFDDKKVEYEVIVNLRCLNVISLIINLIDRLYQKNYEKELAGMFSRAEFLDAKIFNPCQQKFWNETFNSGKIYVLFFHLPKKKVFQINKDYRLLLQVCAHPRTAISQDVQTRFPVQLELSKFLSKIKEIFNTVPVSWIQHSLKNFPLF